MPHYPRIPLIRAFHSRRSPKKHACRRAGIGKNSEGVTALEFALVAPVFLLMMMGTIEFSVVMFVTSVMEGATTQSARLGKTGFVANGMSREQTIRTLIDERTGKLIDMNKLTITAKTYKNFDSVGKAEPSNDTNNNGTIDAGEYDDINGNGRYDNDMGAQGLGDANDVVVYTITYPWQIVTPLVQPLIGNGHGNYDVKTRMVVKNEPYKT